MVKKENKLKVILCKILDATHVEDLGTEMDPQFKNNILIKFQDLESNSVFTSNLSPEDVQEITNLSRPLSSLEMIHFAEELRHRIDPVQMLVPENAKIITTEIIMASDQLGEEVIDLESSEGEIEKHINSKFSIKNKRRKEYE